MRRWPARFAANDVAVVTAMWLAAWSLAAVAGVRFETFELRFWHVIDPALLRDAPLASLVHLHATPPLWNALLAVLLAVFGDGYDAAAYVVFAGLALATALATMVLARALSGRRAVGLAAAAVLIASPSFIAYGHAFFHALPTCGSLTVGILLARRAAERPSFGRLAAVVAVLAALTLLWAAFHPAFLVAALAWLGWSLPGARRRLAAAAAPAVALVAALVIKNGLLFGAWGLSSWSGMNLARVSSAALPRAEREDAIARGELSPLARVRPFAPLERYAEVPDPEVAGLALVDRPRKSDGELNLHHLKYVEISRRYGEDARRAIVGHPAAYLAAVGRGFWRLYLHPSVDYAVVDGPRAALGRYVDVFQAVFYARVPGGRRPDGAVERAWPIGCALRDGVLLRLWFLAILVGGPLWIFRLARSGRLRTPDGVTAAALIGAIAYVTLIGNLAELGENQRFRYTVEPAATVVAAVAIAALVRRARARD